MLLKNCVGEQEAKDCKFFIHLMQNGYLIALFFQTETKFLYFFIFMFCKLYFSKASS